MPQSLPKAGSFNVPQALALAQALGDPGLDSVLSEINLRVAVELAKAGSR